jgi:prepilin signal peptidase PulO-like enzyme (type II secretory pathway)
MSGYWTAAALGTANGLLALALTDGPRGAAAALRQALGPAGRRSLAACLALGIAMGCYTFWLFGALSRDFWQMLALTGCLLCASVTDCARREISVGACVCYAAVLLGTACAAGYWPLAVNALLGAACGAALLGIPHLLRPASVGRGDVLVLAVCGLGSGFPGVIFVLARGLAALAAVSVVLLVRKRAGWKTEMPLAPFLLFGALI